VSFSKKSQRGAALTAYALILSSFTVVALGAIQGLNEGSDAYLTETSNNIAAPRELRSYDEFDEIPDVGDSGSGGTDGPVQFDFVFDEDGQFVSDTDGLCITLEADGRLRQRACDGSSQQFIEVYTDDATETSQLRIGSQCIGVVGNSENESADYEMQTCDEENLKQLFRRNGTQWESGSNRDPLMCMDVSGSAGGDGAALQQYGCHGFPNQQWPDPSEYVPPGPTTPPTPVVSGEGFFVGQLPANADLRPQGDYEDNDQVFVFQESVSILDDDVTVSGVTMTAGTQVCSYIVWYSPVSNSSVVASIDFGAPVLAGALTSSQMTATNQFAQSGVTYSYNRPWENNDGFHVTGNTLDIDPYAVGNNGDMMRVFTECG